MTDRNEPKPRDVDGRLIFYRCETCHDTGMLESYLCDVPCHDCDAFGRARPKSGDPRLRHVRDLEKEKDMDQDKKRAKEAAKRKILHEWDHDKDTRLRLVAIAHHTPGYEDEYSLSELKIDDLGEPSWSQLIKWKADKADPKVYDILVTAIKSLLKDPK